MHLERILHAHAPNLDHQLDAMHATWIALPADALNLDHEVRLGSLDPVDASWMHLACTREILKPSSKTWATQSYTHDQPNIPHTGQTVVKRGYFWSVFSLFDRAPTISKILFLAWEAGWIILLDPILRFDLVLRKCLIFVSWQSQWVGVDFV
jgi:hypothetical protein